MPNTPTITIKMNELDFTTLCRGRYSCRSFSDRPVSAETLAQVLEAGRLAPSACNRQPWRFCVVSAADTDARVAVQASYPREWITPAPYYIVVCGVPSEAWVRPHDGKNHVDIDIAIATEHICLAASSMGLGTCWICNFDPALLTVGLGLEPGIVPMVIVPLGYPATDSVPEKKRKDTDEITVSPAR